MENRRLFTFLMTSLLFMILWSQFLQPKFFPEKKKPKAADQQVVDAAKGEPEQAIAAEASDPANPDAPADSIGLAQPEADLTIPDYPSQEFTLGSIDPESGYALAVDLTSAGAAIESVRLTSPQFRDLKDENRMPPPPKLLGLCPFHGCLLLDPDAVPCRFAVAL